MLKEKCLTEEETTEMHRKWMKNHWCPFNRSFCQGESCVFWDDIGKAYEFNSCIMRNFYSNVKR